MSETIYVQLLNEGTEVYRPVSALRISEQIYEIQKPEGYDPEDEIWEFPPGSKVIVEEKVLGKRLVFVATKSV